MVERPSTYKYLAGDCLYNALEHIWEEEKYYSYGDIDEVYGTFKKKFISDIAKGSEEFKQVFGPYTKEGEFANNLVIERMTNILGINVVVISNNNTILVMTNRRNLLDINYREQCIPTYFINHRREHFEPLGWSHANIYALINIVSNRIYDPTLLFNFQKQAIS